ncbi:MAG: transposase [Tepidisphaeraceae bacterium]|jgi:putative transposase
MPRSARQSLGGEVYHVLNRAALRYRIFRTDKDFLAFEKLLYQSHDRFPGVRVLAWCIMSNHWHLLLWPRRDGELSAFMFWLTMTHAARYRTAHHTVGYGPLYQGRFKSFPVRRDEYLLTAGRYIERNPLRAKLVKRAEDWRWSSLWVRQKGSAEQRALLSDWPMDLPANWVKWVNQPQTAAEQEAMQISIKRNRPFGDAAWQQEIAAKLGLSSCFRDPWRPARTKESGA